MGIIFKSMDEFYENNEFIMDIWNDNIVFIVQTKLKNVNSIKS